MIGARRAFGLKQMRSASLFTLLCCPRRFYSTSSPLGSLTLWYYHSYTHCVKTAVSIPGPLFQAAERLAKRLGIPRSRLYSRAIERYVAETQERDVTALLNEIYADETAELDPALAALQSASIPRDPW